MARMWENSEGILLDLEHLTSDDTTGLRGLEEEYIDQFRLLTDERLGQYLADALAADLRPTLMDFATWLIYCQGWRDGNEPVKFALRGHK